MVVLLFTFSEFLRVFYNTKVTSDGFCHTFCILTLHFRVRDDPGDTNTSVGDCSWNYRWIDSPCSHLTVTLETVNHRLRESFF